MGIAETIKRTCVQTAVYWGSPVQDGYAEFTFAAPVEILCRWEDLIGQFTSNKGEQIYSKSVVYTLQDLDNNGYLFLGTLADLNAVSNINDPKAIDDAYEIKRFDKLPALGSTSEFVRKAYL
jgi:hypothetical protein